MLTPTCIILNKYIYIYYNIIYLGHNKLTWANVLQVVACIGWRWPVVVVVAVVRWRQFSAPESYHFYLKQTRFRSITTYFKMRPNSRKNIVDIFRPQR